MRCAIGKAGFSDDKREGDNKTPLGAYPLRCCYYRPDRVERPQTGLEVIAITPEMGWCDAPHHPDYNKPVKLPFNPSHEKLWRDDNAYDIIIPMGYNDVSPVSGKGSAIFFHLAQPDFRGTEGCIAIAKEEMLKLLPHLHPQTMVRIHPKL